MTHASTEHSLHWTGSAGSLGDKNTSAVSKKRAALSIGEMYLAFTNYQIRQKRLGGFTLDPAIADVIALSNDFRALVDHSGQFLGKISTDGDRIDRLNHENGKTLKALLAGADK